MNLYLILKSTLTAIADAIREKLGSTDDMTPLEMPALIRSISGGGGMELLADYTATEDVSAIQIDFTSAMQSYDCYMVVLDGQFNRNEYPCPAVNGEPETSFYMQLASANTNVKRAFYLLNYDLNGNTWAIAKGPLGNAIKQFTTPINYIKVMAYYAEGRFKTGFNIKVYGCKAQ